MARNPGREEMARTRDWGWRTNKRSKEVLKTTEISGRETREVGNPENKKRLKKKKHAGTSWRCLY
jgi:hypothetical protein